MNPINWTEERRETVELCRRERKLARSRMDPKRRAEYDRNMRQTAGGSRGSTPGRAGPRTPGPSGQRWTSRNRTAAGRMDGRLRMEQGPESPLAGAGGETMDQETTRTVEQRIEIAAQAGEDVARAAGVTDAGCLDEAGREAGAAAAHEDWSGTIDRDERGWSATTE